MFYIFDDIECTWQIRKRPPPYNAVRNLMDPSSGTCFNVVVTYKKNIPNNTYMHVQSIDFGEHPTDGSIATTNQDAKWIEMTEEPQA